MPTLWAACSIIFNSRYDVRPLKFIPTIITHGNMVYCTTTGVFFYEGFSSLVAGVVVRALVPFKNPVMLE